MTDMKKDDRRVLSFRARKTLRMADQNFLRLGPEDEKTITDAFARIGTPNADITKLSSAFLARTLTEELERSLTSGENNVTEILFGLHVINNHLRKRKNK
jgi:hypothetical protein